jgi:predicted ArsR family transcriptional regulator
MTTATNSADVDTRPRPRSAPKTQHLLALLSREKGATIAELTSALGLLPHSARSALTGLRKKGHSVIKSTRDGATCYSFEDGSK